MFHAKSSVAPKVAPPFTPPPPGKLENVEPEACCQCEGHGQPIRHADDHVTHGGAAGEVLFDVLHG